MAEAGLSAAGLLGLMSVCLDIFELGYVAVGRKDDIISLAFQLNIEEYLLARWAENIGILPSGIDHNESNKLSTSVYGMVEGTLNRILSLFDQSSDLIARYEGSKSLEPIPRLNRQSTTSSKIIQLAKNKPLVNIAKSIKWAVRDGQRFEKLISELTMLLKYLFQLVPEDPALLKRQIFLDTIPASSQADLDVLGHFRINSEGDDSAVDSAVKFLSHAARIRRALPIWGVNQALSRDGLEQPPVGKPAFESQIPPSLARWITKVQTPNTTQLTPVMVEWRWSEEIAQMSPEDERLFKHDVARLTKLLSLASQWPQYHTMPCIGYFADEEYGRWNSPRYGIIFQLPEKETDTDLSLQPLLMAINNAKKSKTLPSKVARFHIAQELATAVYYLLTTGWLHKAIHADNLLLFGKLPTDTSKHPPSFPQVKLAGFDFARPDQPGQRSLDPKSNTFLDLYRHHDCRSMARLSEEYRAHGYRKIYDIYSVGVLLFEIGCWRAVGNVKDSFDSKRRKGAIAGQDFDDYLAEKARLDLVSSTCQTYAAVTHRCLTGSFECVQDEEDGATLLAKFEEMVLRPLIDCKKL